MDTEKLTLAEQNQLKQGELSGVEQKENSELIAGEKALQENPQTEPSASQQQLLQDATQEKDAQNEANGEVPPDPQKDFMGYIKWLGQALHKQEALLSQQSSSPALAAEQLHDFYQKSVVAVKQRHHDFDQAADFIYETRAKQLAAYASLYPEMADQNVVDGVIGNELKQILRDCAKKNQNPAEVIYAIAQKIGYTNTSQPMNENLQERHNSARTLAAYNGLTPNGPISLDMLDKMSEAEFSNWVSDPKNRASFNRLMGGGEL
ncbi:hypothetical protein ABID23_001440 [Bartonella silvatica]|uniref:Phage protein n=1 Tax=Bartonella silvatica TaxID=357760 RepID=A0ABV2HIS6_9HYPH